MAVIYHLFSKSTQRSLSKKCKTCRRASTNFECFSNFSHQRTEIYRGFKIKQTTKRVEALRGSFHIFAAILLLFSKSTRKASKKKIFFRYFTDLWVKIAVVFSKIYRRFEMNQTTKRVEALRGNFQIMAVIYHLFSKSTQRSLSKKCKTCRRASIN